MRVKKCVKNKSIMKLKILCENNYFLLLSCPISKQFTFPQI